MSATSGLWIRVAAPLASVVAVSRHPGHALSDAGVGRLANRVFAFSKGLVPISWKSLATRSRVLDERQYLPRCSSCAADRRGDQARSLPAAQWRLPSPSLAHGARGGS